MTFAQMPAELKHKISHRGQAFQGILPQLQGLLKMGLS
ncbi:MAG: non-canonical purine NTP pyrophosphatase [Planktothrix sp. GU0601_MAG3]|nr:MAG: non-canonical purine NTP pyrophosphatase [Planktothrix sp. GU0601_MAG3]